MKRLKKYGWTGMLSLALLLGQPGAKDALAETAENCFEGEQQVLLNGLTKRGGRNISTCIRTGRRERKKILPAGAQASL